MKKILFIENRQRTWAWQWMADFLEEKGCDVYWIVENRYYKPRGKHVCVIPYPTKTGIQKAKEKGMPQDVYDYVTFTDRNINYYGCKNADYYYYYYKEIRAQILSIRPDLVIGESTQFHELLTICICKRENILFLHPSSCRYPVTNFSFYKYDTLEPYMGSGEEYTYEDALQLANDIAERSTQPSYMKKKPFTWKEWLFLQRCKIEYAYSYFCGEHYCTPSPNKKRQLVRKRNRIVNHWEKIAIEKKWENCIGGKFSLMYPMQVQPEANLDVWGYPYKDQTATIRTIAEQLKDDEILIVKPNPKAKFELTDELIELVETHDNIINVPLSTAMSTVFSKIGMVVVVTGTAAMECILSNKPVVTLANTLNNKQRNCPYLKNLKELRPYIEKAKKGDYVKLSDDERVSYINELVKTSYYGSPYTYSKNEGMEKALISILKL